MKDSSKGPLFSTLGPRLGKPDTNLLWELIYGKCKEPTKKK